LKFSFCLKNIFLELNLINNFSHFLTKLHIFLLKYFSVAASRFEIIILFHKILTFLCFYKKTEITIISNTVKFFTMEVEY